MLVALNVEKYCMAHGNTIQNMLFSWLPQPKRFPTPALMQSAKELWRW